MTWPGAPTLYYGDEAGLCGFTDPDNRRTYPWGREDEQMLEFHKAAIRLHKKYPVFTSGSLRFLHSEYNSVCYARFNNEQQAVVLFNNNDEERDITSKVWTAQIADGRKMRCAFATDANGFYENREGSLAVPVRNGMITVRMPATSAVVLIAE